MLLDGGVMERGFAYCETVYSKSLGVAVDRGRRSWRRELCNRVFEASGMSNDYVNQFVFRDLLDGFSSANLSSSRQHGSSPYS
jgi:hypothetical protein